MDGDVKKFEIVGNPCRAREQNHSCATRENDTVNNLFRESET